MTFSVGGQCWDLDCIRDRFSRWWRRRREDRRRLDALSAEIGARPWPAITDRAPDPEWVAEARLRMVAPRYYAPDGLYWRDAWAKFALDFGSWRAASAAHRRECGLPA